MITEYTGDLFTSTAEALGHGANCRGLMGAGIAKQFRDRWPDMHSEYRKLCEEGLLKPGDVYPYRAADRILINIASQEYPGPDAQLEWLAAGMAKALLYCADRGVKSLAIPRIGCGIGGLQWDDVRAVLETFNDAPVVLEVWTL